jgi:D-3-phosphoglycerate dehydrogenase
MCPTIVPLMRETKKEQDIYFTSLIETMKILVATEKPFAKKAVDGIRKIVEDAGYELALLEKYTDKGQLLEAVADVDALIVRPGGRSLSIWERMSQKNYVDALIVRSDKVTAEVIAAAKNLKIVVRAGAGYDNVDLAAASARGIVVMNTPGQNSNAVAELALAMMIFMSRNRFTPGTGTELQGKTLGIHAYGNVGRLVGRKGKALGMNVVAYDPFIADGAVFEADGVKKVASVEELYRVSDFLSLHIPATAQTKGSIGYDLMMSMPKGATLVNTARKEVIDEEGVVRAMTEREDLKYITDIAAGNQAELDEKFGKRVFATAKKMGAETAEANVNAGLAAANQIVDFLKNGNTRFQVNK